MSILAKIRSLFKKRPPCQFAVVTELVDVDNVRIAMATGREVPEGTEVASAVVFRKGPLEDATFERFYIIHRIIVGTTNNSVTSVSPVAVVLNPTKKDIASANAFNSKFPLRKDY